MAPQVKSLSDKAGFLILANLIKYSVGFVMPVVLVRLLSQSDYGTYQQLILISSAAMGILTLGIPSSVYYFYHHVGGSTRGTLIVQSTLLVGAAGIIAGIAIHLGSGVLSSQLGNPALIPLLGLYAVSVTVTIASEHCMAFIVSQGGFRLAVLFETGEVFLRVLLLITPLALGFGLHGIVVGLLLFAMVRFAVRNGFLFFAGNEDFSGATRSFFVRRQLGYSLPMAMVSLSSMVGSTFNKGIIAASFSPAQYAVYAVGNFPIPLSSIFQASVADVLRATLPPLVREGNHAEVARIVRESSRKLSTIVLPSFMFLFAFADQIITLFFTALYQDSISIFRIFVLSVPLDMLILSAVPQVYGRTRLNLYINLSTMVLLVVLSWTLLRWVGFYGAVIATVAVQYYSSSAFALVALRLTGSTVGQLFPVGHLLRVLLAAALAALAGRATLGLVHPALLEVMVAGTVYSLVFLALALTIGILSRQDVQLMRGWIYRFLPQRKPS